MNVNVLVETDNLSNEEWLAYRKMGIGGSDVSSILGINKWKSAIELWLDKTNQSLEPVENNEAMLWGNIMEPVIRTHFAEITGKNVVELKAIVQHPQYPFMLANVDGITVDDNGNPALLEIKTASEYKRAEWDYEVPVYYQTQVQHYLCVTGLDKAYIAVLIGGNTFKIFEVNADKEVQSMLIAVEQDFWYKVQNRIRPEIDGSDSSVDLLNKMYTGGIKEALALPNEAIEYINSYFEACVDEDNAKARKQDSSNHLKELMGNYELATCSGHSISWKSVSSERIDTKTLKEKEPLLYEKFSKTTTSRRFTISSSKITE